MIVAAASNHRDGIGHVELDNRWTLPDMPQKEEHEPFALD